MKFNFLSALLTVFFCGISLVQAQTVTVSPVPQSISWGEKAFNRPSGLRITGETSADADAVAALKTCFPTTENGVNLIIGQQGDEAVAEFSGLIPQKAEGYYLSITPERVVIAGNDAAGTFYGVQTFLQIASQPEVMSATVTDYPDVAERGVVEGFYGNPWSHTDRIRQFEFYGRNKMNVYIYGPKDDPYHRSNWRTPYPANSGKRISELAAEAARNKVAFVWAMHPGNDINWNDADRKNSINKLEKMYELGVRAFAIFFDDISGEERSDAAKQAEYLNYLHTEFVEKHSDVAPLIMCPTQYNRSWTSGNYLTTLGTQMNENVRIMWTGNSVVDMINESDMTWINNQIKRKAYIWLNYPVNDYCIDHMLMGPTYGNDKTIANQLSAFTSNPMEYAEASKVSLYSIADYTWNMTGYNEQESWERAIRYLMPEHADAFRIFCENNIDLGPTGHGLRRANESATFKAEATAFRAAMADGYDVAAVDNMARQFELLINAADELLGNTSEPELTAEITPWVQVMKYIGQRGEKVMDMYKALQAESPETFVERYQEMVELERAQKKVISRDFEGSIKKPNPTVANEVIGPFIKEQVKTLVKEYKSKYDYMKDIFPAELLEAERYYIMYNGKYLTDENANPDRTGDRPVFKAERDNINPQRQEWRITVDPATDRHMIVNAQDGRYVNEYGKFWADKNINPYDPTWHTYTIYRMNGKYAIQNGGNSGNKFWTSDGTYINQGSDNQYMIKNFIFELVPVGEEPAHPGIEEGHTYYIMDEEGRCLTNNNPNGSGNTPTFQTRKTPYATTQLWKFQVVEETGRFKLVSARDNRYVNELGNFGTNPYDNTWNTYIIHEKGGVFCIQNAGNSGNSYWTVDGNRISNANLPAAESFLFRIEDANLTTGVESTASARSTLNYRLEKETIIAETKQKVQSITLSSIDGKVMFEAKAQPVLPVKGVPRGAYILDITTATERLACKVILP